VGRISSFGSGSRTPAGSDASNSLGPLGEIGRERAWTASLRRSGKRSLTRTPESHRLVVMTCRWLVGTVVQKHPSMPRWICSNFVRSVQCTLSALIPSLNQTLVAQRDTTYQWISHLGHGFRDQCFTFRGPTMVHFHTGLSILFVEYIVHLVG
jgi:hypothetical protein